PAAPRRHGENGGYSSGAWLSFPRWRFGPGWFDPSGLGFPFAQFPVVPWLKVIPGLLLSPGPLDGRPAWFVRRSQSKEQTRIAGRQVTAAPLDEARQRTHTSVDGDRRADDVPMIAPHQSDAQPVRRGCRRGL